VDQENKQRNDVYSLRVKAGKRRTYFFDVRSTKGNDYFLTITESKKVADSDQFERHKIFIYKEDFAKFVQAMEDAIHHVKTELLPDFDFDAYATREDEDEFKSENKNKSYSGYNTEKTSSSTEKKYTVDDSADEEWS
jgi:hypothetical protein